MAESRADRAASARDVPATAASAPDRDRAERIARNLRAIADPTRVQLLSRILARPDGRALVGQLADELGLSQPTVSHHMRVLADEGVLVRRQAGRFAWYSIAPDRLGDLEESLTPAHADAAVDSAVPERTVDDLAARFHGVFSPETVARYVEESGRLLSGRGQRMRPSLTARFAAERLDALAGSERPRADAAPHVLFVCVENAGRSQMAAAILKFLAGDRVRVRTAGSAPAAVVNPRVVTALDEIGVAIAGEYPKPLTEEVVRAADVVVTMGCGDACPVYEGRRYLDWELADPSGLALEGVRAVRDDIDRRVRALLVELGIGVASAG